MTRVSALAATAIFLLSACSAENHTEGLEQPDLSKYPETGPGSGEGYSKLLAYQFQLDNPSHKIDRAKCEDADAVEVGATIPCDLWTDGDEQPTRLQLRFTARGDWRIEDR